MNCRILVILSEERVCIDTTVYLVLVHEHEHGFMIVGSLHGLGKCRDGTANLDTPQGLETPVEDLYPNFSWRGSNWSGAIRL